MPIVRQLAKRSVDLSIAVIALIVLSPLMLLLAAAVRRSSPGPILFRQRRVGRDGIPFLIFKFRSMRPEAGGPAITAAGDARITPIGRWMRRGKLDELPQLFNVLRGEMSLVGPRPEVPHYVDLYTAEQRRVLSVRPGITGPGQVRFCDEERLLAAQADPEAYYVSTLLPAKLAIDLEYVGRPSLIRDLALLAQTAIALLQRLPGVGGWRTALFPRRRLGVGRRGSPVRPAGWRMPSLRRARTPTLLRRQ
jgi:lipopolysaccharide/colanic/teichoic acid biosynthesis glycosyltransferase